MIDAPPQKKLFLEVQISFSTHSLDFKRCISIYNVSIELSVASCHPHIYLFFGKKINFLVVKHQNVMPVCLLHLASFLLAVSRKSLISSILRGYK